MAPVRREDFDFVFQPDRLKGLREKLGLTQSDMASLLDIPVNTVSRWERGSNLPDANTLAAIYSIAKERGITPQFFVRRQNPMSARQKRTNLIVSWDFQNIPLKSDEIEDEWNCLEEYIEAMFPNIQSYSLYAYGGDWQSQTKLKEIGFETRPSSYNADRQIIMDSERIFNLHDSAQSSALYTRYPFVATFGHSYPQTTPTDPSKSVYILISNDGDFANFLQNLKTSQAETFVWGTEECSKSLRHSMDEGHFIPWERPYIVVKSMEVVRELKGRPIAKGEFGNRCKKALEEDGYEIFPEDADFSPKSPYASVLKHMELNGLVRVRKLNGGSGKISIVLV